MKRRQKSHQYRFMTCYGW
jgi:hypothetical protein